MSEQNKPEENGANTDGQDEPEQKSRRDFLRSLGRWSAIIIGGVALGGMMGRRTPQAGSTAAVVGSTPAAAVVVPDGSTGAAVVVPGGSTRAAAVAADGSTPAGAGSSLIRH